MNTSPHKSSPTRDPYTGQSEKGGPQDLLKEEISEAYSNNFQKSKDTSNL